MAAYTARWGASGGTGALSGQQTPERGVSMFRPTKKQLAAVTGATAAVVLVAGVAYAYYTTSSVSGTTATGGATVSSTGASALTTALKTGATDLYPGSDAQTVTVTVTNPNSYSVELSAAKTLTLDFANMKSGDTACTPNDAATGHAGEGNAVAGLSADTASVPA